jgi:hypothetical protein
LLLCLTLVVPVAQAADWLAWRKVGDATLTWGPFTVYTSQLRTPDGRYGRENQDQALIITYARDIDRDELVEATRDQWQAQGILQREPRSLVTDAPALCGRMSGRAHSWRLCSTTGRGSSGIARQRRKSLYSTRTASVRSVQHPLPGHLARSSRNTLSCVSS